MSKFRNVALTDFNLDNLSYYKTELKHKASYIILGNEICPSTKKPHLQGFIVFKQARTFKQWKSILPAKVHFDKVYSTAFANIEYCKKDGNIAFEYGVRPKGQGRRTDYEHVRQMLYDGANMRDIINEVSSYQAVRSAEIIKKYIGNPRPIAPIEVTWIWGRSGVGKTRLVYEKYPDLYRCDSFKWWNKYDGHDVVLIDDIRGDFCKFHELLKLTDIYPFQVENKGGMCHVEFTKLFITAPFPPEELYQTYEDYTQLLRRITNIIHLE